MVASARPLRRKRVFGAKMSESTKTGTGVKLLLAHARSPAEPKRAVATAIKTGLPLHKIEEFMDWVDAMCECDTTTLKCTDTLTAVCESSECLGKADFTLALKNDQSQISPRVRVSEFPPTRYFCFSLNVVRMCICLLASKKLFVMAGSTMAWWT